MIDENRPEYFNYVYRRLFHDYYPDPPWTCYFCGEKILKWGHDVDSLHVHHIDHDHYNDVIENLAPTHASCHISHHAVHREVSDATREKHRQFRLGWVHSQETRRKMSESAMGHSVSPESRAKMSAARTGTKDTEATRAAKRAGAANRKKSYVTCAICGIQCLRGGPHGNHLKWHRKHPDE